MGNKNLEELLTRFINTYKQHECLWKVKSKEYVDRQKKEEAYKELQLILKGNNPDATIEDVKRKINSLRSCFRKEFKKVEESKRSGGGTEDIYTSNLWYFQLLMFLKDQEIPRRSVGNDDSEIVFSQEERESENKRDDDISRPSTSTEVIRAIPLRRPQKIKKTESDNVLKIVGEKLQSIRPEDEFDIVGKNVAEKLRKLQPPMRIFAEKLIHDVLFEAQLGTLSRSASIYISPHALCPGQAEQEMQETSAGQYFSTFQNL